MVNEKKPWRDISTVIAAIAMIISLAGALSSFWFSYQSMRNAASVNKVNVILSLREEFNKISEKIDYRYKSEKWNKAEILPPEQNKAIHDYWFFTFNEWYITNKLNDSQLKELWDDYYSTVIFETMKKPAYRDVLCEIIGNSFSRNKLQAEYGNVLDNIYSNRVNAPLCNNIRT